MVDQKALLQLYTELETLIQTANYQPIPALCDNILEQIGGKDEDVIKCKMVALIKLLQYKECRTFIESSGMKEMFSFEYAYCLHKEGNNEQALKLLKGNTIRVKHLIAQINYERRGFEEAGKIYKDLESWKEEEKKEPERESPESLQEMTMCNRSATYIQQKKYIEALISPRARTEIWKTPEYLLNLSIALCELGEYDIAYLKLKESFSLVCKGGSGKEEEHKYQLQYLYLLLHLFKRSKRFNMKPLHDKMNRLLKHTKNPQYKFALINNLISIRAEKENLGFSEKQLNSLEGINLNHKEECLFKINKIIILLRQNKREEAERIFKSMRKNDYLYDGRYILIQLLFYPESQDLQREYLESVLSKKPLELTTEVLIILCQTQIALNSSNPQPAQALQLLTQIFQLNPQLFSSNPNYITSLAIAYDLCPKPIQDSPAPNHIFHIIQTLLEEIGRRDKLDIDIEGLLLYLGYYSMSKGQFSLASTIYRTLAEKNADCSEAECGYLISMSEEDLSQSMSFSKQFKAIMPQDLLEEEYLQNIVSGLMDGQTKKSKSTKEKDSNLKPTTEKPPRRKHKIRYPKDFDVNNPTNAKPDIERWLPKWQRSKYRKWAKRKGLLRGTQGDVQYAAIGAYGKGPSTANVDIKEEAKKPRGGKKRY